MANLARIETDMAQPLDFLPRLVPPPATTSQAPRFSRLEWSVIGMAKVDGLSTLREPGRLGRFLNWLFGRSGNPKLANAQLEALRKMAVLSWHFGFTVPGDDVAEFIAAGFSPEQYELLVHSIRDDISAGSQRIH